MTAYISEISIGGSPGSGDVGLILAAEDLQKTKTGLKSSVRDSHEKLVSLDSVAGKQRNLSLSDCLDGPTQEAGRKYETRYVYRFIKRAFDICASLAALVILSPVMAGTAIAIRLEDGGPALYSQKRTSYKEREFDFYKFRSMCVDADKHVDELKALNEMDGPQFKIKNDPRITKVGRVIRKYSLDELPQLVNVLKGDISIVGPRPNQTKIAVKYSPYARQKYLVRGGLACFRECEGRSNCSFDEWVEMDLKYVRECGLVTDLKIIFKTVGALFTAKGAS